MSALATSLLQITDIFQPWRDESVTIRRRTFGRLFALMTSLS
jgi:hypothetical protein